MIESEKDILQMAPGYLGEGEAYRSPELISEIRRDVDDIDAADMVREIRRVRGLLDLTNERISELLVMLEDEYVSREEIESYYLLKMDLLYHLARCIHPLSSYGKKCISDAIETRKEFEEMCGVYTTRVTVRNVKTFKNVLSDDMVEDITTGRRDAIGAIRGRGDDAVAVGVLCYYLDSDSPIEDSTLRIEWLFVHPDFRGRGVGDSLIGELVYQMIKNGIPTMTATFVAGYTWEPYIGDLFSRWKFMFGTQKEPDTIIAVDDLNEPKKIVAFYRKICKGVMPLSELKGMQASAFIESVLKRDDYTGYLLHQAASPTYFDLNLSCYVGRPKSPDGVMLVHRTPSNMLRVEYISVHTDSKPIALMAVQLLVQAKSKNNNTKTIIDFPVSMDAFNALIGKLIPKQMSSLLVLGVLSDSFLLSDITEDDIDMMLSMSDEELQQLP